MLVQDLMEILKRANPEADIEIDARGLNKHDEHMVFENAVVTIEPGACKVEFVIRICNREDYW